MLKKCWQEGVRLDGGKRTRERSDLLGELRRFGREVKRPYIKDFRSPEQELAVLRVLDREHLLVVMPTGSGKSLIYQFPAWLRTGDLTVVISPLRALMNQHAELLGAVALTSETLDRKEVWRSIQRHENHILLVSPEMLAGERFRERLADALRRTPPDMFVIDEVHCLSDWGHDFRPHYWWVGHHLRQLERESGIASGSTQRLLLTATADDRVLEDIERHFPEVSVADRVTAPLGREEIAMSALEVSKPAERKRELLRFLKRQAQRPLPRGVKRRGIVYNLEAVGDDDEDGVSRWQLARQKRWKANDVARMIREAGFRKAYTYTTRGMSRVEREATLDAFRRATPRKGQLTAVVATNAFGMGMDYQKVPWVCHVYPRPSVMEYWQQVGRAGRQMQAPDSWAEALCIFSEDDSRYAARFSKAPALDGLINSFTIPMHGWMYVWKKGGAEMAVRGEGGGRTRFSRMLEALQEVGLAQLRQLDPIPRKVARLVGRK